MRKMEGAGLLVMWRMTGFEVGERVKGEGGRTTWIPGLKLKREARPARMAARKRTLTSGTMCSAPKGVEGERESFIADRLE